MNYFEKLGNESTNIGHFAIGYIKRLTRLLSDMDLNSLNIITNEFIDSRENGNTIFIIGNGGSASTATTMANDLGFDVLKKAQVKKPFRILSLVDNISVMTAIANDVGYEDIFVNQLKIHYEKGDILLVISASGNSINLIKATEWTKKQGGKVLGLLGFDGGRLKQLCDTSITINTDKGEYGPVEDSHLIINHILAHWFQTKLKDDK